jgi:hypothetical protein
VANNNNLNSFWNHNEPPDIGSESSNVPRTFNSLDNSDVYQPSIPETAYQSVFSDNSWQYHQTALTAPTTNFQDDGSKADEFPVVLNDQQAAGTPSAFGDSATIDTTSAYFNTEPESEFSNIGSLFDDNRRGFNIPRDQNISDTDSALPRNWTGASLFEENSRRAYAASNFSIFDRNSESAFGRSDSNDVDQSNSYQFTGQPSSAAAALRNFVEAFNENSGPLSTGGLLSTYQPGDLPGSASAPYTGGPLNTRSNAVDLDSLVFEPGRGLWADEDTGGSHSARSAPNPSLFEPSQDNNPNSSWQESFGFFGPVGDTPRFPPFAESDALQTNPFGNPESASKKKAGPNPVGQGRLYPSRLGGSGAGRRSRVQKEPAAKKEEKTSGTPLAKPRALRKAPKKGKEKADNVDDMEVLSTNGNAVNPTVEETKPKRVRTGCLTCRERHLKCDERKPTCLNCKKSNRTCRRGLKVNYIDIVVKAPEYLVPLPMDFAFKIQDESREIASEYKGGLEQYPSLQEDETKENSSSYEYMSTMASSSLNQPLPPIVPSYPDSSETRYTEYPRGGSRHSHNHSTANSTYSEQQQPQRSPANQDPTDMYGQYEEKEYLDNPEDTLYMQVFVEEVGLWMDSMDHQKHV